MTLYVSQGWEPSKRLGRCDVDSCVYGVHLLCLPLQIVSSVQSEGVWGPPMLSSLMVWYPQQLLFLFAIAMGVNSQARDFRRSPAVLTWDWVISRRLLFPLLLKTKHSLRF